MSKDTSLPAMARVYYHKLFSQAVTDHSAIVNPFNVPTQQPMKHVTLPCKSSPNQIQRRNRFKERRSPQRPLCASSPTPSSAMQLKYFKRKLIPLLMPSSPLSAVVLQASGWTLKRMTNRCKTCRRLPRCLILSAGR